MSSRIYGKTTKPNLFLTGLNAFSQAFGGSKDKIIMGYAEL